MVTIDTKNVLKISDKEIEKKYCKKIKKISEQILEKRSIGSEMLGWIDYIHSFRTKELFEMRQKVNEWMKKKVSYVIIIGIGGSAIGARAAIKMCGKKPNGIKTIFVSNIYPTNLLRIKNKIKNKKIAIVVISKSGTTLEPAVSYHYFKKIIDKTYSANQVNKYIVAITDDTSGSLREIAIKNKWKMFVIPNDVGGRFSAITPVGMFVMIVAGLNPLEIFKGAKQAIKDTESEIISKNSAYLYACYRNYFYATRKKSVENFIVYDPNHVAFGEVYRQLFGESEGKNMKALYPSVSLFTTDLHSMGQFFQEGSKIFFETSLLVKKHSNDIRLKIKNDDEGIKYLNGKTIGQIIDKASEGTIEAHSKVGKIDNIILTINRNDEYNFGYLYIWMCKATTMSAYLLGVNPFDQPGVEAYKKNMFKLLGKS